MKRSRWVLLTTLVCSCSVLGYFLLRTPECKDFSEVPAFFDKQAHFVPVKISQFSSTNIPQVEIQVEDKTISTKVDLGWDGMLGLPVDLLGSLRNKSFVQKSAFFGMRGKTYASDIYEVPQMHIGAMRIFPVKVEEENREFVTDGVLKKGSRDCSEEDLGRVGWRMFQPFNVLLDCEHSTIIICDSLDTLKKQGYPTESFIDTPLLLDRGIVEFEVMTEIGPLRCMFDTGSTCNLLNKDLENPHQDHRRIDLERLEESQAAVNPNNEDLLAFNGEDHWDTQTAQIGGTEFGPLRFKRITSPLNIDAVIGMEFIDEHLIFIDFRNKKIYFSKLPEERSLLLRGYDYIEERLKGQSRQQ